MTMKTLFVLFLMGLSITSNDKITTTLEAKEFARKNKVYIVEFEGEHLNGFGFHTKELAGDEYLNKITAFLKEHRL